MDWWMDGWMEAQISHIICKCIDQWPPWGRCPSSYHKTEENAGAAGTVERVTLLQLFLLPSCSSPLSLQCFTNFSSLSLPLSCLLPFFSSPSTTPLFRTLPYLSSFLQQPPPKLFHLFSYPPYLILPQFFPVKPSPFEQASADTTDAPTCPFSTFKHFFRLLNTFFDF